MCGSNDFDTLSTVVSSYPGNTCYVTMFQTKMWGLVCISPLFFKHKYIVVFFFFKDKYIVFFLKHKYIVFFLTQIYCGFFLNTNIYFFFYKDSFETSFIILSIRDLLLMGGIPETVSNP